jgi:D-psicose/D-tagatose/L-ribulose 3-epimerase
VKIGCCVATLDDVPALEAGGGEFYELPVARSLMGPSGRRMVGLEEFARLRVRAGTLRLRPRAYNVFLPSDLAVVGPAVDRNAVERYARLAFARVQDLGGGVVVFGSGQARSIPEGFRRSAALDQLEATLRLLADMAARSGAAVALEPLRRAETNLLNGLREAAAFIRGRDLSGVRLLADLYHMMEEEEPMEALDDCAGLLAHVHVADRGRLPPGDPAANAYDLAGFLRRLRDAGYMGDCSIECRWPDFPGQVGASVRYVRQTAQAAGWDVPASAAGGEPVECGGGGCDEAGV